uniref:BED-type domain-containing protein n=1 Tax=Meloidogyne incognita TaxID=6306 RepID=A0A914KY55_MELIC
MSEVWNHFYMAPNGLSVNCNHCGKFMKRSDSSTKSMWGHLKAFHSDLVGEETFRLKRTRRMRGENNGDNNKKSKISRQKKSKIENLENNTECQNSQNSNSSSCSSNISENNTSSEEEGEENIKNSAGFEYCSSGHSGSNTPLFAEGKRQMIKEEGIEEDKHFEVNSALERGKQSALSIQTLLKLEENEDGMKCPQSVGGNDQKFELSHQQLVQLSTLQNQQNLINNQNLLFGLPTSSTPSITSSLSSSSTSPPNFPVQTTPSNIQKSPSNTPSLPKYSTAALLQNQRQQKEGKLSPAHGSEAPQQAINNLNFEMTQQQNLPFDPQILAKLETAAAINQLSQLQQLENNAMLQQLQQRNIQTNEQQVLQQQTTLNEMFALFASELFQQQNQNFPSTNINQNFQQQQAFATWLCNLEWMAAVQRTQQQQQTTLKQSEQETNKQHLKNKQCLDEHVLNGNKNNLTTQTSKTNIPKQQNISQQNISQQTLSQQNINSPSQTFQQQQPTSETFATALQQVLFSQTQSEQQMNKQCFSDLNKHATTKTHQKRKSGLTSATLLATPTPSTSEPPSTPLQVLAETASSINNKMFPNVSTNESQPSLPKIPRQENNFTSKQQQLINEHHLAESLAESLVLYGMHRIAMDLQLSYSVQANKQGKAEYAFYKNSGGIST